MPLYRVTKSWNLGLLFYLNLYCKDKGQRIAISGPGKPLTPDWYLSYNVSLMRVFNQFSIENPKMFKWKKNTIFCAFVTPLDWRISHASSFLSEGWCCNSWSILYVTTPKRVGYLSTAVENLKLSWIKIQIQQRCFSLWSRSPYMLYQSKV